MKWRYGFTLIELLVVIAIIAVLMAILMPAMQRVREQARQRTCAARIRQQVFALHMYAQDSRGKLPLLRDKTGWLQNMTVTAVNHMLNSGMTREMFSCPSNEIHKRHSMTVWMHHMTENPAEYDRYWNGSRFINYDSGDRVIVGYFFILDTELHNREPITRYASDTGDKIWLSNVQTRNPSERELVTDITMGEPRIYAKYGYQFGKITVGGLVRQGIYDTSNHLKNEEEPTGSNIGYLDGHVTWRPWNPPSMPEVDQKGRPIPRWTGGGPHCFW